MARSQNNADGFGSLFEEAYLLRTLGRIAKEEGVLRGRIIATTYGQLTRSAHQRFFKLKEKIPTRYDGVSDVDLMTKAKQTPSQAPLIP